MLSIIVPVLNEAKIIQRQLEDLQVYREQGAELIVVDAKIKLHTWRNFWLIV